MNFTTEQIKKAKQAKSAEEIVEMAQAENVEITKEQAKVIFDTLNKCGELTDDELAAVAGGGKFLTGNSSGGKTGFSEGDIVEDNAGIRYEILAYEETETRGQLYYYIWYLARVIYVPESARVFTSYREGDYYHVNGSFVHKIS